MNLDSFTIRLMQLHDRGEAASVLSIAMQNNPLHRAVLRGSGESQRLIIEKRFFDLFTELPGITFIAQEDRNMVGVMRMKSCCGSENHQSPAAVSDEGTIEQRIVRWENEWARKDPSEQHWHLGPLGVLPSYRQLGVGSALMKTFCAEVDRCRAPAFLETDCDENVHFYQKFGFQVVFTSMIFGVENSYMARPPVNLE